MQARDVQPGTVYWVTGLAGAGKTTLGTLLAERLRESRPGVVLADGDTLREVVGGVPGHAREDRLKLAFVYSRLCRMLSLQGIDVVCATISMFHEVREWNRQHLPRYREIYLRVPMEVLARRDQKGLYSGAEGNAINQVVGLGLTIEEPRDPDVVLDNDGSRTPDEMIRELMAKLNLPGGAA